MWKGEQMDDRLREAAIAGISVGIMVFVLVYLVRPAVERVVPR